MEPEWASADVPADPPQRARSGITTMLVIGLLLMVAGTLLTLDRLDIIDSGGVLGYWPVVPIVVGLSMLLDRRDAGGRFWGGVWVFVGTWLLLRRLGVIDVGFIEMLLPIVLLVVGFRLMMQAFRQRSDVAGEPGDASLVAILSESKRASLDNPFRGGHMTALMGGCQLDLRQAVIPPGGVAVIEIFGLMSGHELWVPSGWNVESNVVPIMAGVEDKRLPSVVPAAPAGATLESPPRLVLRGYVMMSGITIKS